MSLREEEDAASLCTRPPEGKSQLSSLRKLKLLPSWQKKVISYPEERVTGAMNTGIVCTERRQSRGSASLTSISDSLALAFIVPAARSE